MTRLIPVPDKEKDYQAYMVFVIAIVWTSVCSLIALTGFYFFPGNWQRWLLMLFTSIFIAVFNLLLNKHGYTRLASWTLTMMLWLFTTLPCYSAGGIMAPGILVQMSLILTAAFMLGWKGVCSLGR